MKNTSVCKTLGFDEIGIIWTSQETSMEAQEGEVCEKSQRPGYLEGFVGRSCKAFDSY